MPFPATNYNNNTDAAAAFVNLAQQLGITTTNLDLTGIILSVLRNLMVNAPSLVVRTVSIDPVAVAANTTAEQNVTVTGVVATDVLVAVIPPATLNAGLGVCGARVQGANTITLRFNNNTGGSLDPAAANWTFVTMAA